MSEPTRVGRRLGRGAAAMLVSVMVVAPALAATAADDPGEPSGDTILVNPKPMPDLDAYCPRSFSSETSDYEYTVARHDPVEFYKFSDGTTNTSKTVEKYQVYVGGYELMGQSPGASPVFQRVNVWCEKPGEPFSEGGLQRWAEWYWIRIGEPEAVAIQANLLPELINDLPDPAVSLPDRDKDDEWLYVNVTHHLAIDPLPPQKVSATAQDELDGSSVNASITATPSQLIITLPAEAGAEFVAPCTLAIASNGVGCPIRFAHASSVADGTFEANARVWWTLESNSEQYDDVGPFETQADFDIVVAEAMAVSVH